MAVSILRCSEQARAGGYLPAGTAASAATFLLVEVPLPWPADVADHPMLAEIVPLVNAAGARIQGLVPEKDHPTESTVIVYERPDGPFRHYVRREATVPTGQLREGVEALLTTPNGAGTTPAEPVVDVLVCTHGSRDVCCGGDGMRVERELAARNLPGVRVWRTSHTGGHRFAPTAVTFPDGRAWASLDATILAGIVSRTLDPNDAIAHDRGCSAFDDPFVQAADGRIVCAAGWGWLDTPRSATSETVDVDRRIVTVTGHVDPPVSYRAEVAVTRILPVPACGRPLGEAKKNSRELEVVSLLRLA